MTESRKRLQHHQLPAESDSYGLHILGEHNLDDGAGKRKPDSEKSCLSYIILIFLFFAGILLLLNISGATISEATAATRTRFSSFKLPDNTHTPDQLHILPAALKPNDSPPSIASPQPPEPFSPVTEPKPAVEVRREDLLVGLYERLREQEDLVRKLKQSGVVMEENSNAKIEIKKLRELCREYVPLKYGPEPYFLKFDLVYPDHMPDNAALGSEGSFIVKMGPLEHVPYSVFYVLEVVSNWKGGAFHRPAGHVLQALTHTSSKPLAFQEYSPHFPHYQYTLGFAGRPGGPGFYVSTVDNVNNHGPGSQGSRTEADGCWGQLAGGEKSLETINRIKKQPGGKPPSMFVSPRDYIKIPRVSMVEHPSSEQQILVLPQSKTLRGS